VTTFLPYGIVWIVTKVGGLYQNRARTSLHNANAMGKREFSLRDEAETKDEHFALQKHVLMNLTKQHLEEN